MFFVYIYILGDFSTKRSKFFFLAPVVLGSVQKKTRFLGTPKSIVRFAHFFIAAGTTFNSSCGYCGVAVPWLFCITVSRIVCRIGIAFLCDPIRSDKYRTIVYVWNRDFLPMSDRNRLSFRYATPMAVSYAKVVLLSGDGGVSTFFWRVWPRKRANRSRFFFQSHQLFARGTQRRLRFPKIAVLKKYRYAPVSSALRPLWHSSVSWSPGFRSRYSVDVLLEQNNTIAITGDHS